MSHMENFRTTYLLRGQTELREGSLSKHINFTEVTSYKIHILVRLITNGQIVKNLYLKFNKNLVTITLSAHGT